MMPREAFIPNDVLLDEAARVVLLTGPNMAGKSTLLRQVGLCVLLAQMGAFVPARRAVVGVVDRLFTRLGAAHHFAAGQATLLGEMSEDSAHPPGAAPARRRAARAVGPGRAASPARGARAVGGERVVAARGADPPGSVEAAARGRRMRRALAGLVALAVLACRKPAEAPSQGGATT